MNRIKWKSKWKKLSQIHTLSSLLCLLIVFLIIWLLPCWVEIDFLIVWARTEVPVRDILQRVLEADEVSRRGKLLERVILLLLEPLHNPVAFLVTLEALFILETLLVELLESHEEVEVVRGRIASVTLLWDSGLTIYNPLISNRLHYCCRLLQIEHAL